jgi:hypothetical protein
MSGIPPQYHEYIRSLTAGEPRIVVSHAGSGENFDITSFVIKGGLMVARFDIDGPNAGRTMDMKMHRDYLGYKRKIELKFRSLSKEQWAYLEHKVFRGDDGVPWHDVTFEDFGQAYKENGGVLVPVRLRMYHSQFTGTISTLSGKRIGAAVNFIEE